jgi:hypothetical protein
MSYLDVALIHDHVEKYGYESKSPSHRNLAGGRHGRAAARAKACETRPGYCYPTGTSREGDAAGSGARKNV